jgi:hypothetical protein
MVKGLCEKDFLRKPFTILIGSLYIIFQAEPNVEGWEANSKFVYPMQDISSVYTRSCNPG